MTKISTLHQKWMKTHAYKAAHESTRADFELVQQLIETRIKRGLSHGELAIKMGTSQSTIARLESGKSIPSMRTLTKFAQATQAELQIIFRLKKI